MAFSATLVSDFRELDGVEARVAAGAAALTGFVVVDAFDSFLRGAAGGGDAPTAEAEAAEVEAIGGGIEA